MSDSGLTPLGRWIAGMPKAELHLHIEGTLGPETILDLAERNGVDFPYRSVGEIERALAWARGHQGRAARLLGISRKTLWEKVKHYRITFER